MSLWPLYRALAGLGIGCAGLVALVHQQTAPIVAAKRLAALEARVRDVVPGTESSEPWLWTDAGFVPTDDPTEASVWVGRSADGRLAGVAVDGAAMGYQDVVRVLWGFAPDRERIVGMRVLESRETPGLGDRAAKDPEFLGAFEDLPAVPSDDGEGLAVPPRIVTSGPDDDPTTIDALTGATITSRAVVDAVAISAATWVPRIVNHRDELATRPAPTAPPTASSSADPTP